MTSCLSAQHITQVLSPLLSPARTPPSRSREVLYRELLKSYTSYNWYSKPLPLSPIQCARWGWLSIGKDMLQCRECKVRLQFTCSYQVWQRHLYEGVCEGFGAKLQTSHRPACPWAGQPISNDIILGGRGTLFSDKAEFVNNFAALKKSLKPSNLPVLELPGDILRRAWPVLNVLLRLTRSPENDVTVGNITVLFLALLGWYQTEDSLPTLHCKMCLRTLGLWNFRWLSAEQCGEELEEGGWGELRSYTLLGDHSSDRSRETSSASEISKTSEVSSDRSTPEEPHPSTFGNPDIFLPVASYVLFQPKSPHKKSSPPPATSPPATSPPATSPTGEPTTSPTGEPATSPTGDNFKTPSTRVLRSRSKRGSSESTPTSSSISSSTPTTSSSRKRKSEASPPTPSRVTRSASRSSLTSPAAPPTRKRRRSKVEIQTSELIAELMRQPPTKLQLTSSSPEPALLNPVKEHHYWCPWVGVLPEYHLARGRVSLVDMVDSPGWEALLFFLSTCKVDGNAWVTVHNLLEDCVSPRK